MYINSTKHVKGLDSDKKIACKTWYTLPANYFVFFLMVFSEYIHFACYYIVTIW